MQIKSGGFFSFSFLKASNKNLKKSEIKYLILKLRLIKTTTTTTPIPKKKKKFSLCCIIFESKKKN